MQGKSAKGIAFEVPAELRINSKKVASGLTVALRSFVRNAGKTTGVVGVSGGVDSAVTSYLAAQALGPTNIYACLLPSESTPPSDLADARSVIELLHIPAENVYEIPIDGLVASLASKLEPALEDRVAIGNIKARVRMILLHAIAHVRNGLVIGTGDKSEFLVGYFTKYGDGGVDVLPLGDLYKTQVRQMAADLGLPSAIYEKAPSPQLWKGHSAEDELGMKYEVLDRLLHERHDLKRSAAEASRSLGIGLEAVRQIDLRISSSDHKRAMPTVLNLSASS